MSSILDFLPAQSMKPKGGGEWCGPCPLCGGATTDGFLVWTDRPHGGAFLCRKCEASGDGIQFLRDCHGMTYRQACEALRMEPQRRGYVVTRGTSTAPKPKPAPVATKPSAEWMQCARGFLAECQADLETNPAAVCALAARGLTPSTALTCGLGWNPADRYELRAAWGLPPVQDKGKMVLPAGLVIATRRKAGPVALTIRTIDPARPKYWEVAGSGKNLPYALGRLGLPVVLLESALDAVLLHQEAGDLCAAVAFMGNMKGLDAGTDSFIKSAPAVIACPDNDYGGLAAWQRWSIAYPTALCCPAANAKDLGDMHRAALELRPIPTVREWAEAALQLARQNTPERCESAVSRKPDTTHAPTLSDAQEAA